MLIKWKYMLDAKNASISKYLAATISRLYSIMFSRNKALNIKNMHDKFCLAINVCPYELKIFTTSKSAYIWWKKWFCFCFQVFPLLPKRCKDERNSELKFCWALKLLIKLLLMFHQLICSLLNEWDTECKFDSKRAHDSNKFVFVFQQTSSNKFCQNFRSCFCCFHLFAHFEVGCLLEAWNLSILKRYACTESSFLQLHPRKNLWRAYDFRNLSGTSSVHVGKLCVKFKRFTNFIASWLAIQTETSIGA